MRKRYVAILITLFMFTFMLMSSCQNDHEHGDPNANSTVPEGSITFRINRAGNNAKTVIAVGTELDPHFFSQNVGKSGYGEGAWEVREEDWYDIFVPRMRDMKLRRIRVMLLPSWYAPVQQCYESKNYLWESAEMNSLYKILQSAKELGMTVNITMWGIDKANCPWLANPSSSQWCVEPAPDKEQAFVGIFADCIKYLIETKGFDNIKEVTLYNEPNAIYNANYGKVDGNRYYVELCKKMDAVFKDKKIRNKVLFNLSDDACDWVWLGKTLSGLQGVIDVANSHIYVYGDTYNAQTGEISLDMHNGDICYNVPNYSLKAFYDVFSQYDIPHMWGEFGTKNASGSHVASDNRAPSRGIDIPRISLNMFNMGSQGISYWVLFDQYYNRSDSQIMNMGLWGYADESYACRPVYYSYSMITRFVEADDVIYPISSDDDYLVATAFRKGDDWSYLVVNHSYESKKVSFLNMTKFPSKMNKYAYLENSVPTDNRVIESSGAVFPDGRVLTETIPGRSFILFTTR